MIAQRYVVVRVPDWQTVSLSLAVPPGSSAVVVARGRVRYASLPARREGIQVGMKLSTAQILSPNLLVFPEDAQGDAARFEQVIRAVESQVARVYAVEPGLAWALVGGAARWHGSEEAVAEAIIDAVSESVGVECHVGIATGVLASIVAAYRGDIVPDDRSVEYVSSVPLARVIECVAVWAKQLSAVVGELEMLGIRTCGQLVQAERSYYRARFGAAYEHLYVLAAGGDVFLPKNQYYEYDIHVRFDCDEAHFSADHLMIPMTRVAAGVAQKMADARVRGRTMFTVIGTADGRRNRREWGGVSPEKTDVIVRRLRWHMNALAGHDAVFSSRVNENTEKDNVHSSLGGGVSFLEVRVRDCEPADPDTPLWGARRENADVERSVERIQSLLGEDGALGIHRQGAFDPRSRIVFSPWGNDVPDRSNRDMGWEGSVSELPEIICVPPIPVALTVSGGNSLWAQKRKKNNSGNAPTAVEGGAQIIPFPGMVAASDVNEQAQIGDGSNTENEEEQVWEPVHVSSRGIVNTHSARLELLSAPQTDVLAHWRVGEGQRIELIDPVWNVRGRWWLPEEHQENNRRRSYVRGRTEDGRELLLVSYRSQWWIEGVYDRVNY